MPIGLTSAARTPAVHSVSSYLFNPAYNGNDVGIPPAALADANFQVHNVIRDNGNSPPDDWFNKCGLGSLGSSNVPFVGLFVDISGSMTKTTVKNSYNKFLQDAASAGRRVCLVFNGSEDWITPFITTLTPNTGSCVDATLW